MPLDCAEVAMRELVSTFTCVSSAGLMERLARTAAAVVRVGYAGFVRVDPLREDACAVLVHVPPGDPLRVRPWLAESGVLKELAVAPGPVLLACDRSVGAPGFLAMPVAAATSDHAFLWAAGRAFDERDEHLLGRFATAAGRALEASTGLEAAARLLRGVQGFPLAGPR
ncbi:hypothetical protein [Nonomuraea sp. NPDC048826]|uniref:hypothetical protein n=1 Tax=Nonomuraea sp. NPDC048826 TaxID=3364347 RepID=UPI00371829B0